MRRGLVFVAALLASAAGAWAQSVTITTPTPLPNGYVGVPYVLNPPFSAVTNPPGQTLTWLFPGETSGAPPGITLSSNGNYSGTPTTPGTYLFTVQAQFGGTFSPPVIGTQNYSLTVVQPTLRITGPGGLGNAVVGQSFSATFTASSNTPFGTTWSASGIPPGLSLDPSTGILSGVLSSAGGYTISVTAQLVGTSYTATQAFSLQVFAGQIVINTTSLPLAPVTVPYSAQLQATPSSGVTWTLLSGITTLPPGISFSSSGTFSGTPTTIGAYPIQVQASITESNFLSAMANLTVYVTTGTLRIVQTSIPVAIQNVPYQTTLTPSGGLSPYQWSTANTLGLSIGASSGIITGTATTIGAQSLPVTLTDSTGTSFSESLSFFVAAPLSVLTGALPSATVGTPYSQSLQGGGGQAPYTWLVTLGSLPPGLILASNGTLSGTPTSNGTYTFTVQVTDAGSRTATKALSVVVGVSAVVTITTSSLPDSVVGAAYAQTLAASGGIAPYTWAIVSGALPPGIVLSPSGGTISGTPTGPVGSFAFTVQATDSTAGGAALTAQKAFTLNVTVALNITTATFPGGSVGSAYPQTTVVASGGKTPYTWSVVSGALPPGLSLNATTGAISGTPTSSGAFIFIISVTDAGGQSVQKQYSISIASSGSPLSITTSNLSGTVGTAFSQSVAASGGVAPYTFSLSSGSLPAGLTLASSGLISGTPTASGTTSVVVKATDSGSGSSQQTSTATITIAVNPLPSITFTVGSASQPPVTLCSASPAPVTATLTLSFQPSSSVATGTDQSVQFASPGQGSTVSFTLPPCSQNTPAAVVTMGTVAGTITITAKLTSNNVDITPSTLTAQTIAVAAAAPVIQSVKLTQGNGSVTVTVIGYSSTREVVSGLFTFAPATGSTLSQSSVTVQLGSAFTTWYQTSASNGFGSQFMLTVPFTVSGNANDVVAATVQLTNTKGTSAAATSQ